MLRYTDKTLRILTDKYEYYREKLKDKFVLDQFVLISQKVGNYLIGTVLLNWDRGCSIQKQRLKPD